jgi:16S rRNA (uracil1498-N3)-methyltransferase
MKKRIYDRLIYTRELDISVLKYSHEGSQSDRIVPVDSSAHKELFNRLVKVLKASEGDLYNICIPGRLVFQAMLQNIRKSKAELRILSSSVADLDDSRRIFLAQAVPKKDFKECLFLAAQAGVTDVIPVISDFSFTKKESLKIEKLQKTADHACEIARDPMGCVLHKPIGFKEFFKDHIQNFETVLYLDPRGTKYIKDLSSSVKPLFIAGPEGGFSRDEEKVIHANGAIDINLGKRVLPAVSAAAFAVFSYQQMNLS